MSSKAEKRRRSKKAGKEKAKRNLAHLLSLQSGERWVCRCGETWPMFSVIGLCGCLREEGR